MKTSSVPTACFLGLLSLFFASLGWVGHAKGEVLPSYETTDLGFLDCGLGLLCDSSTGVAINEPGVIAGHVEVPDPHCEHAAIFRNGEWQDLGALGTTLGGTSQSQANDINNRGQVVGGSNISAPPPPTCCIARHAFIWDEVEGMVDLGNLGTNTQCFNSPSGQVCITSNFSEATAINDRGQVVGNTSTGTASFVPFIWDEEGGMRDLSASGLREAVDINNRGQIAGTTRSGHAAILDETGLHDLGTLEEGVPTSTARAINNAGDVTGWSSIRVGTRSLLRGFLWRNGVMEALPPLPNDQFSQAFGMNDRGQVVGVSMGCNPNCTQHPVVWTGGDVIEIPGLDAFGFKTVTGINDRGQAVGIRQTAEAPFISRGFRADPH